MVGELLELSQGPPHWQVSLFMFLCLPQTLIVQIGVESRHSSLPATLARPRSLVHTSSTCPLKVAPHPCPQNLQPSYQGSTRAVHTGTPPGCAHFSSNCLTREPLCRVHQDSPAHACFSSSQPAKAIRHTMSTQGTVLHKATPSKVGEVDVPPS